MEFVITRHSLSEDIEFRGRITGADLVRVVLQPADSLLLRGRAETAADHLLILEMLFRRLGEARTASRASENS